MSEHYPTLDSDKPFAKEFNKRQSEHWVRTGTHIDVISCTLNILQDDYDQRHADNSASGDSKKQSEHYVSGGRSTMPDNYGG